MIEMLNLDNFTECRAFYPSLAKVEIDLDRGKDGLCNCRHFTWKLVLRDSLDINHGFTTWVLYSMESELRSSWYACADVEISITLEDHMQSLAPGVLIREIMAFPEDNLILYSNFNVYKETQQ